MKSIYFIIYLILLSSFSIQSIQAARTVVIIDAGHGGKDLGCHPDKFYEKHLTLDTAYRLKALLDMRGVPNIMIRDNDYYLTLAQRVSKANQYSKAIFVSIHYNSASPTSVHGIETFYFGGASRSLSLAQNVHSAMLNRVSVKDRKVKSRRGLYVLKHTRHPSILVEGGFLSNKKERSKVLKGEYRQALAEGIAQGICKFLGYRQQTIKL